jgi:hypothetical protein
MTNLIPHLREKDCTANSVEASRMTFICLELKIKFTVKLVCRRFCCAQVGTDSLVSTFNSKRTIDVHVPSNASRRPKLALSVMLTLIVQVR